MQPRYVNVDFLEAVSEYKHAVVTYKLHLETRLPAPNKAWRDQLLIHHEIMLTCRAMMKALRREYLKF